MADESVQKLEREVEAARARLSGNLSALTAPGIYSDLADGIKQAAVERKDDLVETAKSRATSVAMEVVETLKAKAAANPAAALAIGTGIAWHLVRRPPVVAALVGGGLLSLLRTPTPPTVGKADADHLADARENLKAQASTALEAATEAAGAAREKAGDLAQQARDAAAEAAGVARDKVADLTQQARDAAVQGAGDAAAAVKAKSAALAHSAGEAVRRPLRRRAEAEALPDPTDGYAAHPSERGRSATFDGLMLGAAGIAVAAAAAIMYRRGEDED